MDAMRALLPEPVADVDVHQVYARDWLDAGGIRVNFVSSVDGAVSVSGLSRGLQTPGDNRIFAALRDLADVVLVGSGTARAEGYAMVAPDRRRAAKRAEYGLPVTLPIAVVSASLRLDPSSDLFRFPEGVAPAARTIVITCASAPSEQHRQLAQVAEVIVAGEDRVDLTDAIRQLRDRGLIRVLCEGGPTLFADLLAEGTVSELCLSVPPLLAGPGSGRITAGRPAPVPTQLTVTQVLEEDDAFFYRYLVHGPVEPRS
jgi:riboflavin biosynthesis pyrimidine reductase